MSMSAHKAAYHCTSVHLIDTCSSCSPSNVHSKKTQHRKNTTETFSVQTIQKAFTSKFQKKSPKIFSGVACLKKGLELTPQKRNCLCFCNVDFKVHLLAHCKMTLHLYFLNWPFILLQTSTLLLSTLKVMSFNKLLFYFFY